MIRRLFSKRILGGFALSSLVAALALHLTINFTIGSEEGFNTNVFFFVLLLVLVALYTLIPSALLVFFCEKKSIRHPVIYVGFAALMAFAGLPLVLRKLDPDIVFIALCCVPAGVVSGLVYWYYAGRKAGDDTRHLQEQIAAFD
ncbi:hypothetical protein [Roseibium sp. M-1]